jgi:2-oxoisovalerate dehydrogenase E1 component alpha subunit
VERARRGGGTTLVELVTYRRDAHSTSDDPSQYRAAREPDCWPGGDPIERLKQHLIVIGEWSEKSHQSLNTALEQEAAATFQMAESFGTTATGLGHASDALFRDVYREMPPHLQAQRAEALGETSAPQKDEPAILRFVDGPHRAAG